MNKELTPLEAFQLFCKELKIENSEFARTIETALKREDSIEITAIDIEQDNKELCKENKKLKRALEIIKEKGIDILEFRTTRKAKTYNKNTKRTYVKDYTDEEYDLLKEIICKSKI